MKTAPPTLARDSTEILAARANVAPKTIRRILRGDHVRGMAAYRARVVLVAAGLLPAPVAPPPPPSDPRSAA